MAFSCQVSRRKSNFAGFSTHIHHYKYYRKMADEHEDVDDHLSVIINSIGDRKKKIFQKNLVQLQI